MITKNREKTESSVHSKKTSNNDKFHSKMFKKDKDDELNRSKSSLKSETNSKKTFELKSKIFNDSQVNKKDTSIQNISPIKKQNSEENISKARKHY